MKRQREQRQREQRQEREQQDHKTHLFEDAAVVLEESRPLYQQRFDYLQVVKIPVWMLVEEVEEGGEEEVQAWGTEAGGVVEGEDVLLVEEEEVPRLLREQLDLRVHQQVGEEVVPSLLRDQRAHQQVGEEVVLSHLRRDQRAHQQMEEVPHLLRHLHHLRVYQQVEEEVV